jgi:hypothetical protein
MSTPATEIIIYSGQAVVLGMVTASRVAITLLDENRATDGRASQPDFPEASAVRFQLQPGGRSHQ